MYTDTLRSLRFTDTLCHKATKLKSSARMILSDVSTPRTCTVPPLRAECLPLLKNPIPPDTSFCLNDSLGRLAQSLHSPSLACRVLLIIVIGCVSCNKFSHFRQKPLLPYCTVFAVQGRKDCDCDCDPWFVRPDRICELCPVCLTRYSALLLRARARVRAEGRPCGKWYEHSTAGLAQGSQRSC